MKCYEEIPNVPLKNISNIQFGILNSLEIVRIILIYIHKLEVPNVPLKNISNVQFGIQSTHKLDKAICCW